MMTSENGEMETNQITNEEVDITINNEEEQTENSSNCNNKKNNYKKGKALRNKGDKYEKEITNIKVTLDHMTDTLNKLMMGNKTKRKYISSDSDTTSSEQNSDSSSNRRRKRRKANANKVINVDTKNTAYKHLRNASNHTITNDTHLSSAERMPMLGTNADDNVDDINSQQQAITVVDNDDILSIHPNEPLSDHDNDSVSDNDDLPHVGDNNNEKESEYALLAEEIDYITSKETPAPKINTTWAEKINSNWDGYNNFHIMKPLYDKYKIPENCEKIRAPIMNPEMKRLLTTKWQKKSDTIFNGMQKTLTKVAAASIQLNELNMGTKNRETRKKGMQITADIMTMLNNVNVDISTKRKAYIRSVIKPEYKDLCNKDATQVTNYLFGDNVTQDIKDVRIKYRIGQNTRSHTSYYSGYGKQSSNYYSRRGQNSFLGSKRGRNHYRASQNMSMNYQNQNYQYHNQYQNQARKPKVTS